MALNINSNILSLNAQYNLNKTTNNLSNTMTRLSTGLKINTASDNAAGLAIAQGFTADINISSQGLNNAQDGINLLNVADGALSSMTDMAQRLLVLAQQASNGTVSSSQRGNIGSEFGKVLTALGAIGDNTSFNGTKLLDGTASNIIIQLGASATDKETIKLDSAKLDALSISGISISSSTTVSNAVSLVVKLKAAVDILSSNRAKVGAQQSVLNSDIVSIGLKINALSQSRSSIMDIDVAQETANLTLFQIKQQAAVSILSQANSQPQIALSLLNGR
ncbi:flagellin [Legionella sp. km772]|uniref:flagellin N-terminal helical domain-containing protein n=1 Tax=Legionella sp. km772 TaxID=2498111 RepID=UPI000F8E555D|nr:flagellin [Legionella sp. km772]RUR09588.1 flagellin FliC [Legionella sp. km772]